MAIGSGAIFNKWHAAKRLDEAKKRTQRLVDEMSNLIFTHQNVVRRVLSPTVTDRIPRSSGAVSFATLKHDLVGFQLLRMCAAWDGEGEKRASDKASIPIILRLVDDPKTLSLWHGEVENRWRGLGAHNFSSLGDPELERELRAEFMRRRLAEYVPVSGCMMIRAKAEAQRLVSSQRMREVRKYRNQHLAHNLIRGENSAVPGVMYGDLRSILFPTIKIVWRLHSALNGSDMDFLGTIAMARRNAAELWQGVSFDITARDIS